MPGDVEVYQNKAGSETSRKLRTKSDLETASIQEGMLFLISAPKLAANGRVLLLCE